MMNVYMPMQSAGSMALIILFGLLIMAYGVFCLL